MTDLLSAAIEAQNRFLRAIGTVDSETLKKLQDEQDRTAEEWNRYARTQQARALPTERGPKEESDDDLSYEDLLNQQEMDYRSSC